MLKLLDLATFAFTSCLFLCWEYYKYIYIHRTQTVLATIFYPDLTMHAFINQ